MRNKIERPDWGALFCLAAVAAVVVAAVICAAAVVVAAAAAAEQQDQDDDPPAGVTTETVVVAHNEYLQENFSSVLPLIPRYSAAKKRCRGKERKSLASLFEGGGCRRQTEGVKLPQSFCCAKIQPPQRGGRGVGLTFYSSLSASTRAVLEAVFSSLTLITLAGQPATTVLGATSPTTTAPAATTAS